MAETRNDLAWIAAHKVAQAIADEAARRADDDKKMHAWYGAYNREMMLFYRNEERKPAQGEGADASSI